MAVDNSPEIGGSICGAFSASSGGTISSGSTGTPACGAANDAAGVSVGDEVTATVTNRAGGQDVFRATVEDIRDGRYKVRPTYATRFRSTRARWVQHVRPADPSAA